MGKERDNLESANNTRASAVAAMLLLAAGAVVKAFQNVQSTKELGKTDSEIKYIEGKRWRKSREDKGRLEELKKRRDELWREK